MEPSTDVVVQKDGYKTVVYHFYGEQKAKASIIILHGMAEHHKRYYKIAGYLADHGIDTYIYDHRGHGTDKLLKELGFFDEKNGYKKVIDDAISVIKYVKNKKCADKIFLMGHSMGSLIARNVIQQYDEMDGMILSGSTHPSKVITRFGLILSSLIKLFYGSKHRSPLLNNMMFGSKPYRKLISRTSFDWLSRNNPDVGAYIHDPYCGFLCTISFYHDLLKLVSFATNSAYMKKTRKNLPILIISGDHDPVSNFGKEILRLTALYKKWSYNNVTTKLYPECRHELIQELNADEVMSDIASWITKQ
jgi:alpha-beta hydrolase superfamily lysophospholipase